DSSGSATVSTSGGTGPFTNLWDDASAQTNSTAIGLPAAVYTVNVTDAGGCTSSVAGTITDPALSVLSFSTTLAACGDSSGSSTVTISGGTSPFTYVWNDPGTQTDSTATGLYAATFSVTVTDNSGCISTDTVVVSEATSFTINIAATNVACNGDQSGSALVATTGGSSPFTYLWDDTNMQTTVSATGLAAGNYSVTITDSVGCTASDSTTVLQPDTLVLVTNTVDAGCGTGTGSASVVAAGGTSPYSYLWNDASAQTTDTASTLAAGSYTVVITDSNGCSDSTSITIISSGSLTVTVETITNASCAIASDGGADITVTGGSIPYTYLWSNLTANEDLSGVPSGSYTVNVTDATGCVGANSIAIGQDSGLSVSLTPTPSFCIDSIGTVTALVTGGTPPYVYIWDDINTQTTVIAIGLAEGTYSVTVADPSGCSIIESATVTGTTGPSISSSSVSDESCPYALDGGATVFITGGTSPYFSVWTDSALNIVSTGVLIFPFATISDVSAGTYYLLVTDAQLCIALDSVVVNLDPSCLNIPTSFTPNGDETNDTWIIQGIQNYPSSTVEVYNRWGSLLYSSSSDADAWDGTYEGADVASATYYFIIVLDETEDPITGSVTVVR
ncbi:MAG: gliding motility-associated C-terminal domain-containing protein, partial [Flavobacteriales bacterium]|nr:gliding motility-associated C-terminal domain-containing protein [Flavobacteriales bacterium]